MQLRHRRKQSPALRALTSSALSLSGIAGSAAADSPVERVTADYNYSVYSEDELGASNGLPLAERDRYEVKMHQLFLQAPLSKRLDFRLELVHEAMSGASPYYLLPDAAGSPIQVMSGATIEDKRTDVLLTTNLYYDNGRLGLGTGYSTENDYNALNLTVDGETHFNEKNTTLSGGIGFSADEIEPTDPELVTTRPDHETKKSYTLFTGLSQILSRKSVVDTSLTYRFSDGYLSDPYKQMFVIGGTFLPDMRPDSRHQFSLLTGFRRHVEELGGSFRASYQFYLDDWDVNSHTFELAWHQALFDGLELVPSVRYYSQTEADFYVPFLPTGTAGVDASSDYRLSAYGAVTFGLKGEYTFHTRWLRDLEWSTTLGWERYTSSGDLALSKVSTENPGLVSFHVLSVGLAVRF